MNQPSEFYDKSPEQVASILKARAGGIKRNAEVKCWPIIDRAKQQEDSGTAAFWTAVVRALVEGTEDPKVTTQDPSRSLGSPSKEFAGV